MNCPTKKQEDLRRLRAADHGLRYGFADLLGRSCVIQESPLNTQPAIVLGLESRKTVEGIPVPASRMTLGRDQVRVLLPLLQHFADHGKLPSN